MNVFEKKKEFFNQTKGVQGFKQGIHDFYAHIHTHENSVTHIYRNIHLSFGSQFSSVFCRGVDVYYLFPV